MGRGFINRNRTLSNTVGEGRTLNQLHNQCLGIARILQAIDRCYVGVIEGGQDFGFALETRQAFRIRREVRGQDFNGDVAFELRIGRPVHLTHAARTDLLADLVVAKFGARFHILACRSENWRNLAKYYEGRDLRSINQSHPCMTPYASFCRNYDSHFRIGDDTGRWNFEGSPSGVLRRNRCVQKVNVR